MDFIDLLCIFHGLKGRMEAWRKVCSRPIEARWPDGGRLENPIGPPDGTPIGQARLKNGHRAFFCRHRAIGPIWARWARGTQKVTMSYKSDVFYEKSMISNGFAISCYYLVDLEGRAQRRHTVATRRL